MDNIKVIFDNAIAQLEAQRTKVICAAKSARYAELKPAYDEYVAAKTAEYNEATAALKAAYDKAVDEKRTRLDAEATAYATQRAATLDVQIEALRKLAAESEN